MKVKNKTIHQIWFGGKKIPDFCNDYMEKIKNLGYNYKLWIDQDIDNSFKCFSIDRLITKSDLARFEILQRYGGLYLDIDIEVLGNIEHLFKEELHIAGETSRGQSDIYIVSSNPNNKEIQKYIENVEIRWSNNILFSPLETTGIKKIKKTINYNTYTEKDLKVIDHKCIHLWSFIERGWEYDSEFLLQQACIRNDRYRERWTKNNRRNAKSRNL